METTLYAVPGTEHEFDSSWRQPCHDGCTTWQPGTKGCLRWSREELFQQCWAEVASMPEDRRSQLLARMHAFRGSYALKTPARFEYINRVEWMPETREDFDKWMGVAAREGAEEGLSDMEIAHEAANTWNRFRQDDAMDVLFAYGQFSREEIKAARARWDFTKPFPASALL